MKTNPTIINLDSLLSFSARLNETYDRDFILNSTILSLMGKLKILRACVLAPDGKGNFSIVLRKGRQKGNSEKLVSQEDIENLRTVDEAEAKLNECGYNHFIPVVYQESTLAVLCLGKKADGSLLTDEDEQYLNLVCTISANALQNAKNHGSLLAEKNIVEQRNQLLTTLFEIGRDFTTLLTREQIIKMLSYHLMGQLMVSRFGVFLLNNGGFETIINRLGEAPSQEIFRELGTYENIIRQRDVTDKGIIRDFLDKSGARIISPMIIQGAVKGLMIIGKKMGGASFTDENIQFIEALSNTAIAALENERLFHEEVEKKRMESEMELALEIQKNLLPSSVPDVSGFELAGETRPSLHVGGDYYDFIELSDGRVLLAIADVSGKGMPASLIMANVQAALRLLTPLALSLNELITRINEIIYTNTAPDKFVTFFCGILDPVAGRFKYINAGHNPPVLIRSDGGTEFLTEGGLIIGFTNETFGYEEGEVPIYKGDVLTLYTDGVTEAQDTQLVEFGEDRLISLLRKNIVLETEQQLESIFNEVASFSEGVHQSDDITCVILKRK